MRFEKAPAGRGSAEQFVRRQYPQELQAQRSRAVHQALVVMMDGDIKGVNGRLEQLEEACRAVRYEGRKQDERVAVFVPTWNVETWFAYLDGAPVDECRSDYPRLALERECQRHVNALRRMCEVDGLRQPTPPSLEMACREYQTRLVEARS